MTKLAPEWVRTSDPVIRSPARYCWTTLGDLLGEHTWGTHLGTWRPQLGIWGPHLVGHFWTTLGDRTTLGDHTTTLGNHTWGNPHFGTTPGGSTFGDQIWEVHIWGPHLGDQIWERHLGDLIWGGGHIWDHIWGPRPRLGTTLRPPLIALFLKLCIFYIMKYFLMLWRIFLRHNVPFDILFDIIIYSRTLLT